ncbi:hypothetical protein LTR50_003221 [Elasticomyces elasticus]|nr:hypothetical protein LTR50_003221 [Elasticomyces elasticus]
MSARESEERVAIYSSSGGDEWEDEEDDTSFEPASEVRESVAGDETDREDTLYHDAEESLDESGVEIEFELMETSDDMEASTDAPSTVADNGEGEQTETETSQNRPAQTAPLAPESITISQQQILQLLGHTGLRQLFTSHGAHWLGSRQRAHVEDEDEDDEDDDEYMGYPPHRRRRSARRRGQNLYPKVPSEEGRKLMESGTFGTNERSQDTYKRKKKLAYRTMVRELGLGSPGRQRCEGKIMSQGLLPGTKADLIINYNARCYSGQFSDDGNFFYSCSQDFKVRMYDTSNPYKWKYYKVLYCLQRRHCEHFTISVRAVCTLA